MQAFVATIEKGNIFLQLEWNGLALMYETKNSVSSPSRIPILSLFCPPSQQSYLKSAAELWTLRAEKQNKVSNVSSCFTKPETAEVCQVQNHYVKKWETFCTVRIKN
jgi:hypothetical protein